MVMGLWCLILLQLGISTREIGWGDMDRNKAFDQQSKFLEGISLLSLQKNRPAVVSGEKMGGWEELLIHLRYVSCGRPIFW